MIDDKLIYSMKVRGQNFSLKRFMVRVGLVTLILAAIEVPVIYFYAAKKTRPNDQGNSPNSKNVALHDTNSISPNNGMAAAEELQINTIKPPSVTAQEALPKTTIINDTVFSKTAIDEKENGSNKISGYKNVDTVKPKLIKIDPKLLNAETKRVDLESMTEVPPAKELTEEKMMEIMNDVNAERIKLNKTSRCVKIRKTTTSNVSNAFKIVDYLKAKGFTISGREETSKKQHGISIEGSGNCFVVTIGTI